MSTNQCKIVDEIVLSLEELESIEKTCERIIGYAQAKSLDINPDMLMARKKICDMLFKYCRQINSLHYEMKMELREMGIRW